MKRSFSIFLGVLLLTTSIPVLAQDKTPEVSRSAAVVTPGTLWLSVEENLRNLTDALKRDDMASIGVTAISMKNAVDALISADVQTEVKPGEEEHLVNSLNQLRSVIVELEEAVASGEKVAIQDAVTKASGAVTLTRIDVPPGLLEKISGAAVRAEIINTPALKKGKDETVTLRLKSAISGKPLKSEDFEVVHTERIHALIVDPQLQDYKHVHPEEIDVPGEYSFSINPDTDCTYRLWADVTPVKGKQEYSVVDIPGGDGCGNVGIDRTESSSSTSGVHTATLSIPDGGIRDGQEVMLAVKLVDDKGEEVQALEPLMGAYAHMVGFYDDYHTIAHMHPIGDEPKTEEDRGTSPVSFHFEPQQSGFVKLFLQVRINGKDEVFPFGIVVQE